MRLLIAVELNGRDDCEFADILGRLDRSALEDHFGNLFDAFATVEISQADSSPCEPGPTVGEWKSEVINGNTVQSYDQWCNDSYEGPFLGD